MTAARRPAEQGARLRALLRAGPGTLRSFWPRQRIRRPIDGARLLFSVVAVATLVLLAATQPGIPLFQALPRPPAGLLRSVVSVGNVVASWAVLAVLLGIALAALRSRRFSLTCALLASLPGPLVGLGVALLAERLAGTDVVPLLLGPRHEAAGLPVTAAVAFVVGAHLPRRRLRTAAVVSISAEVVCAFALGSLTAGGILYAVAVGTAAALAVRVAAGVVPARPSEEQLSEVLARAGWQVSALEPLTESIGQARYATADSAGNRLMVTVVDPDRRGVALARRAWRLIRFRAAAVGRPAVTLRGQVERRALTAALAEKAGVAAPRVLAVLSAGPALLLVENPLAGTPLSAADADAVPAAAQAAWAALRRLHDAGLSWGPLTADAVVLVPGGGAGFVSLGGAQPAATDLQRELDVVALLVATAGRLDAATAVGALRSGYRTDAVAEARIAALLQPLALPRPVRRTVRRAGLLAPLRTELTRQQVGGASAAPPRIERVRARTVVAVAAATLGANILLPQLSTVSIGEALQSARPAWLAVAVLGSALTYLGSALTLRAFVPQRLPLGRTTLSQLAASFVTLVTPPAVGHVAVNIRFLQRARVPMATASASVAVKEVFTVAVTVPVLLVCGWLTGVSAFRLSLLPSGDVLAVLLITVAVLAAAVAAPPTRRMLRGRLQPLIRRVIPQLVAAVSDPRRLATALFGVLLLDAGYVVAMDASLRAFGTSLAIPALVVVYLAASTLGSAAPTPGGLGAVEAALVGGLTATGVPVAAALTAVLVFRTVTFWLPAPLGWVAFVGLQRRGWL